MFRSFIRFPGPGMLLLILILAACRPEAKERGPWAEVDEIVASIRPAVIPDREFSLDSYGGIGDGKGDNKPAFDAMIRACAEAGGGRMRVPPGDYLIKGPIHLESSMELHLEEGSRLVFGDEASAYLPMVLTSWEGTRLYNYSPFIYARDAHDVVISGSGEIDGNAADSWNRWKHLQDEDKALSRKMNNEAVPVEERLFGEGHYLRPHLIQFYNCEAVRVEGVSISDAPFWCLHFVFSRHIHVRGLHYDARNYNNDGIDPESSEYVLIEDVTFGNGDDNIAIKAGRDREGRTLGRPSRKIVVRNCHFSGYNAIAVGSEMSGGVEDVFVENCDAGGPVIYGFYLKGNRDRGGYVRNIYARQLEFDTTRALVIIDSDYKGQGSCCPPRFSNIRVEGIRAAYASDYGIYLKGWEGMHLDSVSIRDVELDEAAQPMQVRFTDHLELQNVRIGAELWDIPNAHAEAFTYRDEESGRELWQVSSDTAPAVACYFEGQAFSAGDRYLVYASRRDGQWRLYRFEPSSGLSIALSPPERKIMEDDYSFMPGGQKVSYLDGWQLLAVDVESLVEEVLFDFSGHLPVPPRFSGSFTRDGRYTLVYVRGDQQEVDSTKVYRIDLQSGELLEVLSQGAVKLTHPLLNPANEQVFTYVPGPDTQNDMSLPMEKRARSWKVDLDKRTNRQFLTVPYGYRATHESWSKDGERFFYFRKTRPGWSPVAVCSQDSEGGDTRVHYESESIRLGHGTVSPDGKYFVSDSQEPGRNELVLIHLESEEAEILCWPNASIEGGHSARAHVHPSFSTEGKHVVFTSDRSETSQVYAMDISNKK